MFGGNKTETAPFKGEPTRDSLTQPPPGYQTPSPNFAYGTGPKESLNKDTIRSRQVGECVWRIEASSLAFVTDTRWRRVRAWFREPFGSGRTAHIPRIVLANPLAALAKLAPQRS